ncbi:DegT/DnrJ/EryC1/StrS family aminotransferase [Rhodoblastus acidophilus]|uniref:DegT/DnrJ/EryC1/StrS family aminotransferase n=2 Tax=Candidatus Rhodoblastus alkanivorans TaxID=2954117 RepID=A0ABS9ZB00_9HYPH|nr:DegT/DnrJ/EryC1/StrS family aminotransferase [Candidatus Rhodoblastus alkanivorans]MCI4684884.1 DegT/DnrJ/EryC1/StrS family aminotransferase [Candidatus Rhodoblastus alkanivorans]MDI4642208.1 DegT/DnrJ/EryC1/StrS family aminotransferase [Rhodoblastus acidophilus]
MMPFIDLAAQRARIADKIEAAVRRVIDHGAYIMGPEVYELEKRLAAFCGAKHAVSCASGTDALTLVLLAKGVKPGVAVLCPSFTFAATAEAVALLGGTPFFVDVLPDTFNMDPASLEAAIAEAREKKLNPVGVIAVDLFGQPADYDAIEPICARENLWLLCDAAQAFGATFLGRKLGTFGMATTTSFFPAKPLGAYGDGGAVFTDDDELADVLRSLRVHGQGVDKYDNVRIGVTGRLDTIQAAILLEKLAIFPEEISARNEIAARYAQGLREVAIPPAVAQGCESVWAQYTIRLKPGQRDGLVAALKEAGVPTACYYPVPLHRQTAYRAFPSVGGRLAATDQLAQEALSLPMHPYLGAEAQERIIGAARKHLG